MRRRARHAFICALVAFLVGGCASAEKPPPQEGQAIFQAGSVQEASGPPSTFPGPPLRRPAILVPDSDPGWHGTWIEMSRKKGGLAGGQAGLTAGLGFVQMIPLFVAAWPVAAGVVGGMTLLGLAGGQMDGSLLARVDLGDRATLFDAATRLQPDRLLRETVAQLVAGRTGQIPQSVVWHATLGADTLANDPVADALAHGADGVLNVVVETFGLALGEEEDLYGVFVRVRAQLVDAAEGRLRYERVLEHGPGRALEGLPRPATHTAEFLSLDEARVFRHEVREIILRMARLIAEDPALPLGPP